MVSTEKRDKSRYQREKYYSEITGDGFCLSLFPLDTLDRLSYLIYSMRVKLSKGDLDRYGQLGQVGSRSWQ